VKRDFRKLKSQCSSRQVQCEKTDANSVGAFMLDRDDGLQTFGGISRSNGVAFYVPPVRHAGSRQAYGAGRQVRQDAVRAQERSPNYRVVAAWFGFLLLIGAGAFAFGMVIHSEATAKAPAPPPEAIYYCAMSVEMPAFELCKEMKGTRDI
jgi:hypothetical protein